MNKKILIVEDDNDIAEIEKDYLLLSNYDVDIENDGLKGYEKALNEKYDLIILDVMLPSMNGYEICAKLREKVLVPIIMVTAKTADIDKIRGLGIGADDYIDKPFSPSVLVAKVNSQIKLFERLTKVSEVNKAKMLEIDDISIDVISRQVFKNGEEVILKNKEYELLYFLMLNRKAVFSKEEIYEKIWGMEALGDNATVAVHINRLREKIEDNPNEPKHLCTVWGAGYCFR